MTEKRHATHASDSTLETQVTGLSSAEVEERVAAGKANANTDVKTKSVGQILAEHAFTLFNAVNVGMAVLVAVTGQWRNLLFLGVVVCNLVIGVFQEIRAKRMVDRLSILTEKRVRVMRGGQVSEILPLELVLDDCILLAHGEQVPADSVILKGQVHVDESLLTGESRPVPKGPGDTLLSGSFIDSGDLLARVTKVGQEGYAARINAEAKYVKPVHSQILDSLNAIIRLGTYALFPLGIGLFLRTVFTDGSTMNDAILSAVAAVVGMIPQGLVLLTSSILAIATTRLAMRRVLVQQTYCVETLARVDTLCLDKTGTITTGHMEVSHVEPAQGHTGNEVEQALAAVVRASEADANDTAQALLAHADAVGIARGRGSRRVIPFDSRRKRSGCVTAEGRAFVLGAARFVLGEQGAAQAAVISSAFDACERVLVVCEVAGFDEEGVPQGKASLLGVVGIRDEVRATAPQTMRYFVEQGVDLRIISGDDPTTVSAIAARADVPHASEAVDASTLATEDDLVAAARHYHVFGRVTPEQKRSLVHALREDGHVVAMTGDGVNDVLALREADCSISVASGSAAARNVSEIVLADNDFSHMPEVVAEGRRSINNLQRSASLFLVKTVYTALLALICIFFPPYPFIPIQMSLISAAIIGIPSFVLALEPNHDRVSGGFLGHVLARSMPASAGITVALAMALVAERAMPMTFSETSTVCMLLVAIVGIRLIWRISQPMTPLRTALLVTVAGIVAVGCTVFGAFFKVAPLTPSMCVLVIVAGALSCVLFDVLFNRSIVLAKDGEGIARLADRLEETHVNHRRYA
ncbi:HAD-IC family P-type ATPase [Olsenella sp. Marseille-P4559]|uniref:HAD-IC family P-type ATPase n=1 Tax=Olsenella sp. Marseille-P4559 TaxID=2364795 RepID=UPI0010301F6E|nr:HAD-IC family P-type ATPase [Olsenella sp. Marseille-P4559]